MFLYELNLQKFSMRTSVVYIVFCLISLGIAVKIVPVQKCCKLDESFDKNLNACKNKTDFDKWNLRIYSIARKGYWPKGSIPPNWNIQESQKPQCKEPIFLQDFSKYIVFQNGSLFLITFDTIIHPHDYCIDYQTAVICKNFQNDMSNVRSCCGDGAVFSTTKNGCVTAKNLTKNLKDAEGKNLIFSYPECKENQKLAIAGKLDENNLFKNGSLLMPSLKANLPHTNYCLEHILETFDIKPSVIVCQENLPQVGKEDYVKDIRFTIYPIGLALSCIFLAATLVSGFLLPVSHHVLHWRCQTNYVICLLIGDFLLCIVQISGDVSNKTICVYTAVLMHFFLLSAFFWLNTMCFNIWWTFRDLRPQSVEKSQERCRLKLYEIYAWGVPFLLAGVAAFLTYIDDPNNNLLKPGFGQSNCWFGGDKEKFTFFYGPIGVLIAINLTLFTLTARELTCGLWKRELVKSTTERAALGRVCIKLVFVMGVTWAAEVLSWLFGGPQELWYMTDITNTLQGVFIFCVIGCQPQVLAAMKRFLCVNRLQENGTAGTSNHHSSSSHGLPSVGDTLTNSIATNTTNSTLSKAPLETCC